MDGKKEEEGKKKNYQWESETRENMGRKKCDKNENLRKERYFKMWGMKKEERKE